MTRPALSPRTARTLTSIGVFGAAVLLSSCQSLSPQTTELQYDAADGTSTSLGSLKITDLAIVSPAAGQTGKVQGMVTNSSAGAINLTIHGGSGTSSVTVPALTAVRLDGQEAGGSPATVKAVVLTGLKEGPGKTSTVSFETPGAGKVPVEVPVLLDQYPYGDATVTHAPASPTKPAGEDGHGAEGEHPAEAPAAEAH